MRDNAKVLLQAHYQYPQKDGESCMKRHPVQSSRREHPQLRRHRRLWGLSAKELSKLLGIKDPAQLSRIEHGKRPPKIEVALASQALFGVSPAEMFPHLYALAEERIMRHIAERHLALADSTTPSGMRKRELYETALNRAVTRPDSQNAV
jgi:transcriptional regulator with XRE-family HTH domain